MTKGKFLFVLIAAWLIWWWIDTGQLQQLDPNAKAEEVDVPPVTAKMLDGFPPRDEATLRTYDRDDWRHWVNEPDGWDHWTGGRANCNTREAALIRDGWKVTADPDSCVITGGTWRSSYDRQRHGSPSTMQIDHVVALAEAHASGGARWSPAKKERFANDPLNVQAVTGSLNQSKGDGDIAEWLPEYGQCAYVARWVVIKDRYGLSMDHAEKQAARRILGNPRCQKGNG